jgi:hypothetical protein
MKARADRVPGVGGAPKRRLKVRGKIKRLPPEIREELNRRLVNGGFSDYRGLSRWLEEQGYEISPSAINTYARRFEQRLEAVRLATAQARAVVEAAPDDDDRINQALMKIVQTTLFEMMIDLNDTRQKLADVERARKTGAARIRNRRARAGAPEEVDGEGELDEPMRKYPTKADLAAVGSVGRTVASLARVELQWRKWREQAREAVERQVGVASEKLSEAARSGGLSPEAADKIRAALLEIRV